MSSRRLPYERKRRMTRAEIAGLVVFALIALIAMLAAIFHYDAGDAQSRPEPLSPAMERIVNEHSSKSAAADSTKAHKRTRRHRNPTDSVGRKSGRKGKSANSRQSRPKPAPRSRDYVGEK